MDPCRTAGDPGGVIERDNGGGNVLCGTVPEVLSDDRYPGKNQSEMSTKPSSAQIPKGYGGIC